ncbi:hypothetical protein ACLVWQ_27845, partial [Streptomyces sp. CWNU-52B]|uniref:hypothetical protein n=1 Tax=unclassified Streptomyces TaxID=2593676 RepID=UPI0039C15515
LLAESARVGVEGAKAKDVTDLFDTYLMDLASIAITSDYRMNAAKEPGNTAKVYNAYKELLAQRIAEDSPVRALLPADKGMFGVVRDFTHLATSLAANNRGDSIQRPTPTDEARPRLPQTTDTDSTPEVPSTPTPQLRGPRDSRPRFVVRSGFDARRFSYQGERVTDLTVRVALRGTDGQATHVFDQLGAGVREFLNVPGYRLPNGDRLHVTVELVDAADTPHLTVDLVDRDRRMDQNSWWADADPVHMVHELTHQLGLRDEYRDADSPHRPHVPGSLLGALDESPEDASLAVAGLRGRHMALLGALIGDLDVRGSESVQRDGVEQSWDAARADTAGILREAVWVDPVSLPRPADGSQEAADVPPRVHQNPGTTSDESSEPYVPLILGNYKFTNLQHTNEKYRDKAAHIVDLLQKHDTIRQYVGNRQVRITLHVRRTETPADVTDLGGRGVVINLASYYFEKYDIGYIMGMLAHEIGLHPLASRDTNIPDEEEMFQDVPLAVPGLAHAKPPRTMSTAGAGQADHIMAAFTSSTRHRIYRDIVVEMAGVLAADARLGVNGTKPKDVTDLIDTYLMDLATIALTNDRRKDAAWEPRYTARVYNAYKEMFTARLADDSPVRALVPTDKSWYNVTNNFLGLGTSVVFNNQGASIHAVPPPPKRPLWREPRFVVRSGFDVRRFMYDGDPVTDLTVRVALRGVNGDGDGQSAAVFGQLGAGVAEFLNAPGYRLPNGDLLHVSVELVAPTDDPHLTVDLVGRDRAMDQTSWWADADPVQMVHELTHQLGLRDEYRDADSPHRPHIAGSLLGALNESPEDFSLAVAGLRDRHMALLGALIGDVDATPQPQQSEQDAADADLDQTWDAVRNATTGTLRKSVWVDPVSLPQPADRNRSTTEVPARMQQDPNATPVAAEPVLSPFKSGRFEFTNLKHTDVRYRDKAVRIIELLGDHPTIRDYIGSRQVRITLHLRTTETPADVTDRGENGVDINLASYYFEKFDVGYIMGMLAH